MKNFSQKKRKQKQKHFFSVEFCGLALEPQRKNRLKHSNNIFYKLEFDVFG